MRVISYGGGVQSTAMVIMAATHDPEFETACGGPIDAALFSNVGDDSEHPATLDYVRNVIQPWAAQHDLPAPGKSSCYFCPFHRPSTWAEMRRDEPDLFWKSVEIETMLNERRKKLEKDNVWFTRFNKPLDEAIGEAQTQLPGLESIEESGCDTGHCFT